MKHKVGDIVTIKSTDWYNANKDDTGDVMLPNDYFTSPMSIYCGRTACITKVNANNYKISIDLGFWNWTDNMFNDYSGKELKFTNIQNEKYRVYCFGDGSEVKINNPIELNVSSSGGHRVLDNNGISHYIPYRWNHLYWEAKTGYDKFVK